MRELLFWLHPKSDFGQCRLTVSRYHLLSLLKFIVWFAIGTLTGFTLSHIYTHHQYEALSGPLCNRTYWLHLLRHRQQQQQQQKEQRRPHLVQILVIHIGEEARLTFKLKRRIWRQIARQKMVAINNVLHFVDENLYRRGVKGGHLHDPDWLVPLTGLRNMTFVQGLKMIIYHFFKSMELNHEFYCFVTDNVQLDHRKLRHLLNSVSFLSPLLIEKGTRKEKIQHPGCLLASNCSLADGIILSRPTLENALYIIQSCMLSKDLEPVSNIQNRFYECVAMATLFECVESPKVHRIFRLGYKCESMEEHSIYPDKGKYPNLKSSHFPMDILITKNHEIDQLQQRSMHLSLESSAVASMVDLISHNRSLVAHQRHFYQQWSTSQTFPQDLPFSDSLETSPWHYTNDRYIYTTHNLHKSPTQKLSVRNSSRLLTTTQDALIGTWQMFDQYITRLRFRYSYRHVHPVLGARHLLRFGAILRPKYPTIKPRLCNITFYTYQKYQWPPLSKIKDQQSNENNKHISIIVPVAGRQEAFIRFLQTLGLIFLTETNIDVIFVVFKIGTDQQAISIIESLRNKHQNIKIKVIIKQELFARASALQIGVTHTQEGVILLFVDVDMVFTNSYLNRVRLHTLLGQQAYFPIYFSQYNSALKCESKRNCSLFSFKPADGLWRYFGFGMASIYKQDFLRIGGYDLSIKGWGQEDIRFYEASLKNLTVFRAPDPGLVHVYHNKSCSSTLTPAQYEMCLGSKFNIFDHQRTLANVIYNNEQILHRSVHRIFRLGYKCESMEEHSIYPDKGKYPNLKSSHFPMDILITKNHEIDQLQQRSMLLSLESSAVASMVDLISHNRSLVAHQKHFYQQWSTSQTFPQDLPFSESLETSPWHYTNDRYIYTTHNLHKSPTQKLSVRNSSRLLTTTQDALIGTWQMFDQYITRLRFRYSYRHVHPVLGARHLLRFGAILRPKYPTIKPRLCNITFYTYQKYQWPPLSKIKDQQSNENNKHISIIVPVAGRQEAFIRFLQTLGLIFLTETNIDVIFVVFKIGTDQQAISIIESLRNKHQNIKIKVIIKQELFARASALQIGVTHTQEGVILLFVDVDMVFTNSYLNRVRLHTLLGQQAYFPIYFSQYNSALKCESKRNCSLFSFKPADGLWRYFGFGMASIYKQDFLRIGGYDLSIKGWGQEDIRFYEASLKNLTVFRAPDPGLVHVYHNKSCSSTLTPAQYEMCLGSKFNIFDHQRTLANVIYNNEQILHRSVHLP